MGDHRPTITVDFEMHGHKAHYDYGWRNWGWDGSADEIADWIRKQAEIAYGIWREQIEEDHAEQAKAAAEKAEREQLAKLKAKYEPLKD